MATPLRSVPPHGSEHQTPKAAPVDRRRKLDTIGRRARTIRAVTTFLANCGWTQKRAADVLGMSHRLLQLKLDPEGDPKRRLAAEEIDTLCEVVPGFAEQWQARIQTLAPDARLAAPRAPESHLVQLTAEVGDVARTLAEARADGVISAAEVRRMKREARDVSRVVDDMTRDLGDG